MTEEDRPLALEDLVRLVKRRKWTITTFSIGCALLATFFAASRPVVYQAEATFREKNSSSPIASGNNFLSSLAASFAGVGSGDQDVTALLKSRIMMEDLIHDLGLQASVTEAPAGSSLLTNVARNVISELAYVRGVKQPVLADYQEPIAVKNVRYNNEVPLTVKVTFTGPDMYVVGSDIGKEIGFGHLEDPFVTTEYAFTVFATGDTNLVGRTFTIGLTPLPSIAKGLSSTLKVKPTQESDKIIQITFSHPNRQTSSVFVNGLMSSYQNYLRTLNDRYTGAQLDYLKKRQTNSASELRDFMREYAQDVTQELNESGIFDTERELEYLLLVRQATDTSMKRNRLELMRLQAINPENPAYYQALMGMPELPALVNKVISEINELRHRRDYLELALQSNRTDSHETLQLRLNDQIQALQTLDQTIRQAEGLAAALNEDRELPSQAQVAATTPPLVGAWYGRVREARERLKSARAEDKAITQVEWGSLKNHAVGYLNHVVRLAKVQKSTLEERLAHQQDPVQDLQGIDLETASNIYIALNAQRNDTEAQMRQNTFILEQMKDPSFEVSSLSHALTDPVGKELVSNASKAVLSLRDNENRSEREQERLREELLLQRTFLESHLAQTNQLLVLRDEFLKDKIHSLQVSMLELLQQRISVAEKHLADYIRSRVDHLKHEQELLTRTQDENQQQMARLPNRWVSEQILQQRLKLNKSLVEEVSKLVESKNIAHHLDTIQSAPVDAAITPLLPKRPWLMLYAVLGGLAGALLSSGFVVVNGVRKGLSVSPENLTLAGQHVSGVIQVPGQGKLDQFFEQPNQLSTLRRIAAHVCETPKGVLLMLTGSGPDYSGNLAALLAREGHRVVRLSLAFNAKGAEGELPGLLQVLEGQATDPKVISEKDFDQIVAGGVSPYASELVQRPAFTRLVDTLQTKYDWVLVVSPTKADSAEAESFAARFDRLVITVRDEKLQDIMQLIHITSDSHVSWVVSV